MTTIIKPLNPCHIGPFCRIWTARTLTGEGSGLSTLEAIGGMMATAMVVVGEVVVGG